MKKSICNCLIAGLCMAMLMGCGKKAEETTQTVESVENIDTQDTNDGNNGEGTESSSQTTNTVADDGNNENTALETPSMTREEQLLASLVGNWQMEFNNGNNDATATLYIRPTGEYEMNLVYGDNGWTHGEYSGEVIIENLRDDLVVSFKLNKTSDANFSGWETIGDFYVDGIRENDYGDNWLYLTQANNGDSIFSMYMDTVRPMMVSFDNPYEGENAAKYYEIKSPSDEYYYMGNESAENQYSLVMESVEENNITDENVWFNAIGETQPDYYWMDENYIYCKSNVRNYEYTQLDVYDNTSDDGEGKLLYSFNMSDFQVAGGFTADSAYTSFVTQGIRYALIKDNILYISTGHRTYSESCPQTGYITAINIENGKVIWKSAPRVCNTTSFDIVGDTIVCGYGFTAEPDYLNVIDIKTGSLLSKYDVKNKVEYVVYKEGKLYVRTYSYNYVFRVE